jgi:hypothetical protein
MALSKEQAAIRAAANKVRVAREQAYADAFWPPIREALEDLDVIGVGGSVGGAFADGAGLRPWAADRPRSGPEYQRYQRLTKLAGDYAATEGDLARARMRMRDSLAGRKQPLAEKSIRFDACVEELGGAVARLASLAESMTMELEARPSPIGLLESSGRTVASPKHRLESFVAAAAGKSAARHRGAMGRIDVPARVRVLGVAR